MVIVERTLLYTISSLYLEHTSGKQRYWYRMTELRRKYVIPEVQAISLTIGAGILNQLDWRK